MELFAGFSGHSHLLLPRWGNACQPAIQLADGTSLCALDHALSPEQHVIGRRSFPVALRMITVLRMSQKYLFVESACRPYAVS